VAEGNRERLEKFFQGLCSRFNCKIAEAVRETSGGSSPASRSSSLGAASTCVLKPAEKAPVSPLELLRDYHVVSPDHHPECNPAKVPRRPRDAR
jgi:hypothetical protein